MSISLAPELFDFCMAAAQMLPPRPSGANEFELVAPQTRRQHGSRSICDQVQHVLRTCRLTEHANDEAMLECACHRTARGVQPILAKDV